MRRWLFNLATAVSLGLCVAVGVLWVRSARHYDALHLTRCGWPQDNQARWLFFQAVSNSGTLRLDLSHQKYDPIYFSSQPSQTLQMLRAVYPPGLQCYTLVDSSYSSPDDGFALRHEVMTPANGYRHEVWGIGVRHWLPLALLLVLPSVWMYRFRKARRVRRLGLCPTCGYDLRATPQRCPECGAVAARDQRSEVIRSEPEGVPSSR